MENKEILEQIHNKLTLLVRLQLCPSIAEQTPNEKMILLRKIGLKPKEIADLLGTTANVVSVTLSRSKKKKLQS
jgi:hypothetical protein